MMLRPGNVDLEMWADATVDMTFTWYEDDAGTIPVDLTHYDATLYVIADDGRVLATYTSASLTPEITLGGPSGTIELDVAHTDANLPFGIHRFVLSVTETLAQEAYWLLEGRFQVHGKTQS